MGNVNKNDHYCGWVTLLDSYKDDRIISRFWPIKLVNIGFLQDSQEKQDLQKKKLKKLMTVVY